jgi:hypothetical protein
MVRQKTMEGTSFFQLFLTAVTMKDASASEAIALKQRQRQANTKDTH